jgi:DNA mismatch repair protein MutS2
MISRLDALHARARYGEDFSCVSPEISESGGIRLEAARNPILLALSRSDGKEGARLPVAVDIRLETDRNLLMVSGPNRGGNTVTLKTLGLMTLMTQAGIPIPAAEGSTLRIFDHCMADIGDDQDIQTGLSTFSAHAGNLKRIVDMAGPRSLVIIDEPGMGTDPNEGAALTMAVLDDLSQKGTFVALATHLNRLKAYGLMNQQVLNASVEFDPACKRPTFSLRYGSPGISHALEMARGLGMPTHILEKAKGYLDQDDVRLNRLIEKIHRLIGEVEAAREKAEDAREGHQAAARDLKAQLTRLDTEKQAFMETYREEAEATIRSAREELKQVINLLKTQRRHGQSEATQRCDTISRDLTAYFGPIQDAPPSYECTKLRQGQLVFHTGLKQRGVIHSVDPSGDRAVVMIGSLKLSADMRDLQPATESEAGHARTKSGPAGWTFDKGTPRRSAAGGLKSGELNVVGYHVDEAIPLIDRAVDRALVEGRGQLTIIHGHGTGRLRGAIRDHLKGMPFIKAVCGADPRAGGDGVTVAEIG